MRQIPAFPASSASPTPSAPRAILAILLMTLCFQGCAQQPQMPLKKLPPLPVSYLVHTINANVRHITELRLVGTLTIRYFDSKNRPQSISLHAVLLIKRVAATTANLAATASTAPQAEVLLLTTYLGQNALELGLNRHGYWLINHQKNQAYVGQLNTRGIVPPGVLPINPSRLLALLAMDTLPSNGLTLMTEVPGRPRLNLLVLSLREGHLLVHRRLSISRYSGRVTEVELFNSGAIAAAISHLRQYPAVSPTELFAAKVPISALIARKIDIEIPTRKSELRFSIHSVYTQLPGKARFIFARPSFHGDTVHVIHPAEAQ